MGQMIPLPSMDQNKHPLSFGQNDKNPAASCKKKTKPNLISPGKICPRERERNIKIKIEA